MNSEGYFTITSGENHPAEFVSNFTSPVKLGDDYEIGLQSITHGPVYNIPDGYNKISIKWSFQKDHKVYPIRVDPGFYYSVSQLFKNIYEKLTTFFAEEPADNFDPDYWGDEELKYALVDGKISIRLPTNAFFYIHARDLSKTNPLQYLFHMPFGSYKRISDFNNPIPHKNQLAFLYSSVIGESYINSRKSRLLAIVPLTSENGYTYFEFTNVSYYPLAVSTFTDILFSLKDVHGKQIQLGDDTSDVKYPTILNLHIRKRGINREHVTRI